MPFILGWLGVVVAYHIVVAVSEYFRTRVTPDAGFDMKDDIDVMDNIIIKMIIKR